MKMVWSKFSLQ